MKWLIYFLTLVVLLNRSEAQWVQANGPFGGIVSCFAVNGTNLFAGSIGGGVFLSTNNGTSWTAVNTGLTNTDVFALAVSGTNLFAGTAGGVFLSTNNGTSWTVVNTGLTNTYVLAFAVSGTNLFAGTLGRGVWRRPLSEMIGSSIVLTSPNGGETWYKRTPYQIRWTSSNFGGNVQILLKKGTANPQTISGNESNDGSFTYTPPCGLVNGTDYRIIVAAAGTSVPFDESDGNFTITTSQTNDPCNPITNFKLTFPNPGSTPYVQGVSSVFDHSMILPFLLGGPRDSRVISFTNDTAKSIYGVCDYTSYKNRKQKPFNDKQETRLPNYMKYEAGGGCGLYYLNYDGHPGYDYKIDEGTLLRAVESGTVYYPNFLPYGATGISNAWRYHVLEIRHDNPRYRSYYIHVRNHPNPSDPCPGGQGAEPPLVSEGTHVNKGDPVARAGKFNATACGMGAHLHYELLFNANPNDPNGWYPVDPYGWSGEIGSSDPYLHPNSTNGNVLLWEQQPQPYAVNARLSSESRAVLAPSHPKSSERASTTPAITLSWVYENCSDSLSHFEITRIRSNGSQVVFPAPALGCPYYSFVDSTIVPNEFYNYYVRAIFTGSSSGASATGSVYTSTTTGLTHSLFPSQNFSIPFAAMVSGPYHLNLIQPLDQVIDFSRKTGFASLVDSVGFFLRWELTDPSGHTFDRSSPLVGNLVFTDTSQSFVVSVQENETGIWNLSLSGTENIPVGDSLVVTARVDSTRQAVLTVDRNLMHFGGVAFGTAAVDSFSLSNIGNLPLSVSWRYVGPPQFVVANDSTIISPLGDAAIRVVFAPTDSSSLTGNIMLVHNGESSPDTLRIMGFGGIANLTLDRRVINFGGVSLHTSKTDSIRLASNGTVNLEMYSVMSTNSRFTVEPTYAVLPPQDSVYLYVTFVPDSLRTEEGKIILRHNGPTRTDTINVHAQGVVAVAEVIDTIPDHFFVEQNYPNPFNPSTRIKYGLPRATLVALEIYNILGQRVAILVNEQKEAGYHEVMFQDSRLASGVYFYRLKAGSFVETKKLVLLR